MEYLMVVDALHNVTDCSLRSVRVFASLVSDDRGRDESQIPTDRRHVAQNLASVDPHPVERRVREVVAANRSQIRLPLAIYRPNNSHVVPARVQSGRR